jgi:uncharacterized protein (TIGR02246 family)
MLPRTPEEWPGLFERHLNAGDLDAVASLYDPGATFVSKSGETLSGREAIRGVLSRLIDGKARLQGAVVRAVKAGDVAVLYTDWHGTIDGNEERSRAIEVLRRQPDGTWLLVVGDPNGRD